MSRRSRGVYIDSVQQADFDRPLGRKSPARRFKAFVPARIAGEDFSLLGATAALAERAGGAVRDLNSGPPGLVPLESLARQLLRSEALASSRIEGLGLSHRVLAQAAAEGQGTHRALEVLGNIRAMESAVRIGAEADEITRSDICEIHRALAVVPPLDSIAGELREEQGWIGGATPADAEYVGPPHEKVAGLVDDLCEFMNRNDVSPVTQAAIAHAQFELIHPFGDGNGRVGRCLIHCLLRRRGIAHHHVPPISLVLGANKDAYIAGLQDYQHDELDEWISQFARAVEVAVRQAAVFSDDVTALQAEWVERAGPMRRDAAALKIIERLPAFPFITSNIVQELTGRSDVASLKALDRLDQASILTRHRNRRKGDSWEAPELFVLLDRFERAVKAQ